MWIAFVAPLLVGAAAVASDYPGRCEQGKECYEFLPVVPGIPIGWALAAATLAGILVIEMVRARRLPGASNR